MPLTEQQQRAFQALRWLHSDAEIDRRTGRSYVLALAYIHQALNSPADTWIEVEDHFHGNAQVDYQLFVTIRDVLRVYGTDLTPNNARRYQFRLTQEQRTPEVIRFITSLMLGEPEPETHTFDEPYKGIVQCRACRYESDQLVPTCPKCLTSFYPSRWERLTAD